MPRSYLSEKEREASRKELRDSKRKKTLKKLIQEKKEELHITSEDIGRELGISARGARNKVCNLLFEYEELSKIFQLLQFENDEILMVMGESINGAAEREAKEEEQREKGVLLAYNAVKIAIAGEDDPLEAISNMLKSGVKNN